MDGRLVLVGKRAAPAQKNGKPKALMPVSRSGAKLMLHGVIDKRSPVWRFMQQRQRELAAHVGGKPSLPQAVLFDLEPRLEVLVRAAQQDIDERGLLIQGKPNPAADLLLRTTDRLLAVLREIGIKPAELPVPDLDDYLAGQGSGS